MNIVKLHRNDKCRILADVEVSLQFRVSGTIVLNLYADDIILVSSVREYWYKVKLVSGKGYDEFRLTNTSFHINEKTDAIKYFRSIIDQAPEGAANFISTDSITTPYAYFGADGKLIYPPGLTPTDTIKYASFCHLASAARSWTNLYVIQKSIERHEKTLKRLNKGPLSSKDVLFYIQDREFSKIDLAIMP